MKIKDFIKNLEKELEYEIETKVGYYGFLMSHYDFTGDSESANIMRREIDCVIGYHNHVLKKINDIYKRNYDE